MLELIGELDRRQLAIDSGFRNTAAMLVRILRIPWNEARARVAAATAGMSATLDALAAGEINAEHVHEIRNVLAQAPLVVAPVWLAETEATLVEAARQVPPLAVRKLGRRLLADWYSPDGKPAKQKRQPARKFHYSFNRHGKMKFSGEFDLETGVMAGRLLESLASPTTPEQGGDPDYRTEVERQGDAVASIFDLAARACDLAAQAGKMSMEGFESVTIGQLRQLYHDSGLAPAGQAGSRDLSGVPAAPPQEPTHKPVQEPRQAA